MLFAPKPVIPQHFAVIRLKNDQGVVILAGLFQTTDDPPDMGVDLCGQAQVQCAHQLHIGVIVTAYLFAATPDYILHSRDSVAFP